MTEKEINHVIAAVLINTLLVVLLIKISWNANDKAIALMLFLYPLVMAGNLIVWLNLKSKSPAYKAYRLTTIILILLFLPLLLIAY
jgi:hypothetical protein